MEKRIMIKKQKGFTLIELVVVLVLLGIIGAVATARFQDLAGDARLAALTAIAAEIQSGSSINYAEGVVDGSFTVGVTNAITCAAAVDDGAGNGLLPGGLPAGWTVTATPDDCGAIGNVDNDTCTLTNNFDATVTTTFTVLCTG